MAFLIVFRPLSLSTTLSMKKFLENRYISHSREHRHSYFDMSGEGGSSTEEPILLSNAFLELYSMELMRFVNTWKETRQSQRHQPEYWSHRFVRNEWLGHRFTVSRAQMQQLLMAGTNVHSLFPTQHAMIAATLKDELQFRFGVQLVAHGVRWSLTDITGQHQVTFVVVVITHWALDFRSTWCTGCVIVLPCSIGARVALTTKLAHNTILAFPAALKTSWRNDNGNVWVANMAL